MDRELEINLLLFRIKIRFPAYVTRPKYPEKSQTYATLSRSASDWEFYKMNNTASRRPFTLTKSYAALNFICDLEDSVEDEESVEEEDNYCSPHVPEVYLRYPR